MNKKSWLVLSITAIALFGVGCSTYEANSNTSANAAATTTTRTAADNSEITTNVDANGVKTETRTFRNNPRVSKIVVTTTKDGKRTVRAYSPSGQEKEITDAGDALEATGDKIADGAGWTTDKGEDVADKTVEGAKTAGQKTVEGTKSVVEKTGETAKSAGTKTVAGAKKVGEKTVEGAKKTTDEAKKTAKKLIP